jgi:hypothetical protein
MSDISNQLIKDSYNYVLQSDLVTGVVYRIGGTIPVNPIFQSGLTVNSGFTYSNGTEQNGYALLTDGTGYAYWGPVSGVTSISTSTGLSASSSTGAVTIINTAPDQTVTISGGTGITTGGTYPNFTIVNSLPDQTVTITGGTNIQIVGNYPNFGVSFTGTTGLNYFVSGSTPSGVTLNSGDRWLDTTTGDELVYVNDGDSQQWIQICCGGSGGGGGSSTIQGITGITGTSGVSATTTDFGTTIINTAPDQTVTITGGTNIGVNGTYPNFGINFTGTTGSNFTGGTVTGPTNFTNGLTANTISATTYQNLPSSFQSVRINNTTQFSANTGTFLNFSGINITITSAATNTLVFSAATGGGGGVTQITAGNGISISPTGGTGNVKIDATTLIASSSLVIVPDSSIYVGNSIYGWNSSTWNLTDTSFVYPNINCGIPLPINILQDETINICGMAYLDGSGDTTKCDFGVYLYRFDCSSFNRGGGIQMVTSGVTDNAFDSNGLYCFNLTYQIPKTSGSEFSACTDFLTIGFSSDSAGDSTEARITFTINAS